MQDITQGGEETIDGTAATRYTFTVSAASTDPNVPASTGDGEAWIAKDSGYLLRVHLTTNEDMGGQAVVSDATITFSRFNDPAIKVEAPVTTASGAALLVSSPFSRSTLAAPAAARTLPNSPAMDLSSAMLLIMHGLWETLRAMRVHFPHERTLQPFKS